MKIITLTLSPAIDIEYSLGGEIVTEHVNRVSYSSIFAGGKGINVSRAIRNAALENGENSDEFLVTVAPIGGSSGKMLEAILEEEGLKLTSVVIKDNTRVNISIIPEKGDATEINAPGTPIGKEISNIENIILDMTEPGDVVIIAGSCPKDIKKDYPSYLVAEIKKRGGFAVLDCDGEALRIALSQDKEKRPDLIKPNTDELGELTKTEITDLDILIDSVGKIDIDNIITTMAGDGAVLTQNGESRFFKTEKVKAVRQKGAGDTFLGNFVYWFFYKKLSGEESMIKAMEAAKKYVSNN